ncbi:MAG: hypothetical protein EBX52_01740 [Proteobacteria bacterium]|nr:hypothetical protein [Pseudomonadota bacterium]
MASPTLLLRFCATLLIVFAVGIPAEGKELLGRIGLGYNAQFANTSMTNGSPGISMKYGIAPRSAVELIAGFYSGSSGSGVAALKYMQTIRAESYANFYFLVGGGYVYATGKNGVEFLGGLGSEFFIPGVDNVGISFEAGMSAETLTSSSGSFILKTFGLSFLNAGMQPKGKPPCRVQPRRPPRPKRTTQDFSINPRLISNTATST